MISIFTFSHFSKFVFALYCFNLISLMTNEVKPQLMFLSATWLLIFFIKASIWIFCLYLIGFFSSVLIFEGYTFSSKVQHLFISFYTHTVFQGREIFNFGRIQCIILLFIIISISTKEKAYWIFNALRV